MHLSRDVVVVALSLGIAGLAPHALAVPQKDGGGGPSSKATHEVQLQTVQLSPVTVRGQHVPLPVALQMVKAALKRPWSSDRKDAKKLVCRFRHVIASHLPTMYCLTNGQYFDRYRRTQSQLEEAESQTYSINNGPSVAGLQVALDRGLLNVDVGMFMNQHPMSRGRIMTMLHYLPPADSSYTLRVVDHGKPVMQYVIVKGEVVSIQKLDGGSTAGGSP